MSITIEDFTYDLPEGFIANEPVSPRDHSKLMVVDRKSGKINHHHFYHLPQFLTPNDVLVLNQTKVFPARLIGKKTTGGKAEILLIRQLKSNTWLALGKPKLKLGQKLIFNSLQSEVINRDDETGDIHVQFNQSAQKLQNTIEQIGATPLPPYIRNTTSEQILRKQYQTTYAKNIGSCAAPTAGFHFTPELIQKIKNLGVKIEYVTLHVGPGTFQTLRSENIESKTLHTEYYSIKPEVVSRLNQYKQDKKRIIAVGTTSARTLESAAKEGIIAGKTNNSVSKNYHNSTSLFIYPPYQFQFVDSLITNFHLPKSSLLMLVTAFTTQPNTSIEFTSFQNSLIFQAYQQAIAKQYRFFSFGDSMFLQ